MTKSAISIADASIHSSIDYRKLVHSDYTSKRFLCIRHHSHCPLTRASSHTLQATSPSHCATCLTQQVCKPLTCWPRHYTLLTHRLKSEKKLHDAALSLGASGRVAILSGSRLPNIAIGGGASDGFARIGGALSSSRNLGTSHLNGGLCSRVAPLTVGNASLDLTPVGGEVEGDEEDEVGGDDDAAGDRRKLLAGTMTKTGQARVVGA
jgi:hypothetical protein